jgi:hypothetical protein
MSHSAPVNIPTAPGRGSATQATEGGPVPARPRSNGQWRLHSLRLAAPMAAPMLGHWGWQCRAQALEPRPPRPLPSPGRLRVELKIPFTAPLL